MSCQPYGLITADTSRIMASLTGSVLFRSWARAAPKLPIVAADPSSPTAVPKPSTRVAKSCSCLTLTALPIAWPICRRNSSRLMVRRFLLVISTLTPTSVAETATLESTSVSVVISRPSVNPKAVTPGILGELYVSSMPALPRTTSNELFRARTSSLRVRRAGPMTFSCKFVILLEVVIGIQ